MLEAVGALVPSIGVGLLFWFAVRAILNADRRERAALARLERAEREQAGREQAVFPEKPQTPSVPLPD